MRNPVILWPVLFCDAAEGIRVAHGLSAQGVAVAVSLAWPTAVNDDLHALASRERRPFDGDRSIGLNLRFYLVVLHSAPRAFVYHTVPESRGQEGSDPAYTGNAEIGRHHGVSGRAEGQPTWSVSRRP